MWAGEKRSHQSQKDRGAKERKAQNRNRLGSPPEKIPFSFCLPQFFNSMFDFAVSA